MAPTTLIDMKTSTSPVGRVEALTGKPLLVSELLAQIPSATYIERVASHDVPNLAKAKKAVKKAFQYQAEGKGFSMVEILGTCPIGWNMTPADAMGFVKDTMMPYFPLGVYKDAGGDA